jgi:hypothetical protein
LVFEQSLKGKEIDYKGKGTISKCKTCGKFDKGECYKNKRTYFICQKPGHLSWQCLEKDQKPAEDDKKKNQVRGRVYTLNAEEIEHSKDLIQGTGLVKSMPVNILFDSGAITRSFQ